MTHQEMSSKGGKVTTAKLTPEQMKAWADKMTAARKKAAARKAGKP